MSVDPMNGISAIAGAWMGSKAQNNATNQATQASNAALLQQQGMYQQQRADFQPYQDMGTQGVKDYNAFKADPTAYLNSPAYQWQKQQIDKNMNRQLSARGRSNSSYGMNALANAYGQLGATEYQNAYNRMLDTIKIGQNAASSTGNASQNMAGAYGQNANNLNSAYQNQGQNQASLYSGLGASYGRNSASAMNGLSNMRSMFNNSGSAYGGGETVAPDYAAAANYQDYLNY